jgi:hypothetical protein
LLAEAPPGSAVDPVVVAAGDACWVLDNVDIDGSAEEDTGAGRRKCKQQHVETSIRRHTEETSLGWPLDGDGGMAGNRIGSIMVLDR